MIKVTLCVDGWKKNIEISRDLLIEGVISVMWGKARLDLTLRGFIDGIPFFEW